MAVANATVNFTANPATNVVRVAVPSDVHNDLAKFLKVQKDILGKLGCGACCSGWDIRFNVQRQFVVDKSLDVQEIVR